jgi:plastocyanin
MKPSVRPIVLGAVVAGLAWSCGGGGGGAYGGATAPNPAAATTPTTSDPGTTVVGILGDRGASSFAPDPVTVKMGQKVAWKNQDGILHRIVQDRAGSGDNGGGDPYGGNPGGSAPAPGDGFDGGDVPPGAMSNAMSLSTQGTIHYHCAIHPSMTGSIVVQ